MNYTLPNPFGLDYHVENAKQFLYSRLCSVWGVDDNSYNAFGRATRRKTSEGWQFNFYNPASEQYVNGLGQNNGQLFFEDTMAAVSFFTTSDPISGKNGIDRVKAQVLFFVDLAKITPGGITANVAQGQRLDEVAINDVKEFFRYGAGFNFVVTGDQRGVDNVLKGYAGANKNNLLMLRSDTFLCFAIDLELTYNGIIDNTPNAIPPIMPQLIPQTLILLIKNTPDNTAKIQVGTNTYIQQQYAPGSSLTPMIAGSSNGFLAGKKVVYPFTYNDGDVTMPNYDEVRGIWTKDFADGDYVAITFNNQQF